MRIIRFTLLLAVLLVGALTSQEHNQGAGSVFVKDSEIYVTAPGAAEAHRLTNDGQPKSLPALSKDGSRIVFNRGGDGLRALAVLVALLSDGTPLREIVFRPPGSNLSGMRFVEKLEWISNQRLVVSGSLNPSTAEYAVIDVGSGEQVKDYMVDGFNWAASPDGSHAAYVGYVPHFTQEEARRPQLCLDDECPLDRPFGGYPGPSIHLEFVAPPVWSPDSSVVAIVAEKYETKAPLVIVRSLGGKNSEFAPPRVDGLLGVSWEGTTLVVSTGSTFWSLERGSSVFTIRNSR
jgi:hypothetical protein